MISKKGANIFPFFIIYFMFIYLLLYVYTIINKNLSRLVNNEWKIIFSVRTRDSWLFFITKFIIIKLVNTILNFITKWRIRMIRTIDIKFSIHITHCFSKSKIN